MSDEHRDVIGLFAEFAGEDVDVAQLLEQSYEWAVRLAIALLHRTGRVHLPADWMELTDGFVITADPLPDGRWRIQAQRRGESRSDSPEANELVTRLWREQYGRGG